MINFNDYPQFFLGCNSERGFVSKFENAYDPTDGWRAFIIKGGPGTGKSTLMKKVAAKLSEKGEKVIISPCTGDPDSLDAVIAPGLKVIIMDGTAPHIVEGTYIGASERIVNLGAAFDNEMLYENREKIIGISDKISKTYSKVYRYTSILGAFENDIHKMLLPTVKRDKINSYCRNFAKSRLKKLPKKGTETVCFLDAITCRGKMFFDKTAPLVCKNVITVCDGGGTAADILLKNIKTAALENGYDVAACPDPLNPGGRLKHLLIPEAGTALVSEPSGSQGARSRKIHAKRFYDEKLLSLSKERRNFDKRAMKEIEKITVAAMAEAKSLHDELEKLYTPAVDFAEVDRISEKVISDILKLR